MVVLCIYGWFVLTRVCASNLTGDARVGKELQQGEKTI